MKTLDRREDIPVFKNEAEEHEFWASHELSGALWDQAEPFSAYELPVPRRMTAPKKSG